MYDDAHQPFGVIAPDRKHAAFPMHVIERSRAKGGSDTSTLLFSLLSEGALPPAANGGYTPVT